MCSRCASLAWTLFHKADGAVGYKADGAVGSTRRAQRKADGGEDSPRFCVIRHSRTQQPTGQISFCFSCALLTSAGLHRAGVLPEGAARRSAADRYLACF